MSQEAFMSHFILSILPARQGADFLFSGENFTTGSVPKTTFRSKQATYSLFVFLLIRLWVIDGMPPFLPWQRRHNLFTNAQAIATEMNMR